MKDGGGMCAPDGCVADLHSAAQVDGNTALEGRGGALLIVDRSSLLMEKVHLCSLPIAHLPIRYNPVSGS